MRSITDMLLGVPWWVPLGLYIVFAFIGVQWLRKHLADQPDQIKRLTLNYAFCAAIITVLAIITNNLRLETATFIMMGVGVLNGIANITQWRANRTSLSKTSLLAFGDDIIAILLAVLIIGDGRYLTWISGTGTILCLLTGFLFWWHSFKAGESTTFYKNVLVYSLLWGVCDFSQRYYAVALLPAPQFLFGWYMGTFLTIGSVFLFRHVRNKNDPQIWETFSLSPKNVAWVALFAVGTIASLAIEYWARMLAPQTVVQPILLVAEAVIPTIVGVKIFKEGYSFDRAQKGFAMLGIVGVTFLAVGFHS
jgi:hypothetical protein